MQHQSDAREHKPYLIGLARRRALETYLRFGRVPGHGAQAAEGKAVNPSASMPAPALTRATRYYVWRSTGDDRVRHSHALRHGKVFSWSEPPPDGHPGIAPNCRCWAAPYYGDPSVPDALQPLNHHQQVSTDPTTQWASLETLTRSDGSMAQSLVVMGDGTTIQSRFQATSILREVLLADGQLVRVDTESALQSIYLGSDSVPQFQSRWTPAGPRVVRARQHLAFLRNGDPFNDTPTRRPEQMLTGPGGGGGDGLGAIALALTAIQAALQLAPVSQGLGKGDRPTIVFRTWKVSNQPGSGSEPIPVFVGALSEEQLRQSCRRVSDVQKWINEAAAVLEPERANLSPQAYGNAIHFYLYQKIQALKADYPGLYDDLESEISFLLNGTPAYRGEKGSVRYDVYEKIPPDKAETVCVYDAKTGDARFRWDQLRRTAASASRQNPGATIIIVQMGIGDFSHNGPR